ncbi:MAG: hypothetical protein R3B93_00745 [Bacteroidia bacterium]
MITDALRLPTNAALFSDAIINAIAVDGGNRKLDFATNDRGFFW